MELLKYIFIFISFVYINLIQTYIVYKYIINTFYFIYLCYNINYILENIINLILNIKIKTIEFINYFFKNDKFQLKKVLLYTDLNNNYDVTKIFRNTKITFINKFLINHIYEYLNLDIKDNENIRLKIYFKFKSIDYIIYFSYNNNNYIPYPPYSEEIINNYRNDIVFPYYSINTKKKYFYSLFQIESKDILNVKINSIENNQLLTYFKMIQTPFNDFGILYDLKIKLKWILEENNINDFNTFHLSFLNLYFDEDLLDLKEHIIEYSKEDLEKYIISKRMEDILLKKIGDMKKLI